MLGNDIVDLALAQKQRNWRRAGYVEKIFTDEEQSLIASHKNADSMVWLLWSMKEAAYKVHNRTTQERSFNPITYKCELLKLNDEMSFGLVKKDKNVFSTKSELNKNFIHTIAISKHLTFESIVVKHLINQPKYTATFNQNKQFSLSKDINSLPEITNLSTAAKHNASISHDGKYLRIVFERF